MRARAERIRVPQELLVSPDVQRRLAWAVGEEEADGGAPDVSVRALAARLTELGARPWQVEQAAPDLSDALA